MVQHSHSHGGGKKQKHLAGKLIALVQLILSVAFIIVAWNSGMVPVKYLIAVIVVLFLLFALTFGLQYVKNKIFILGIVLSVLISICLAVGVAYLSKANRLLEDVGGATYKTDNMIVVVKKDDLAQNLLDAGN